MANKGKDTNTSQFFISYRACKHLDRKHTIFGRVVEEEQGKMTTLDKIERVEVSEPDKKPVVPVVMTEVVVLVDSFEEFLKGRKEEEERKAGVDGGDVGREKEDDRVTWTGKTVRGVAGEETFSVGKYLNGGAGGKGEELMEEWEAPAEPVKKKVKGGSGFGNFDSW